MRVFIFLSLMGMCAASASAQADFFGNIFKTYADLASQSVSMALNIMKQANKLVPYNATIQMAEESLKAAQNYPEQMLAIFQQGASMASNAAGGMGNAAEGAAKVAGGMANPFGAMTNPLGAMANPLGAMVNPLGKMSDLAGFMANRGAGMAGTSGGIANVGAGMADTSGGIANVGGGMANPLGAMSNLAGLMANRGEGMADTSGGMANVGGGMEMDNPNAKMFQVAVSQIQNLKESGAPKEDYMTLLQEMKEAMV